MFSKKPKEQFAPPVTRPQVNRPMTQGPTFSILGADMAINHHTRSLPVLLIVAAIGVFGSISIARFVARRDGGQG